MSDLDVSLGRLSKTKEAKFLSDFLFNLTIGVRAIHILDRSDIIKQLYGVNQIFHAVLPYINLSITSEETSHTILTLAETIRKIGIHYEIERYVEEAWVAARMSPRNQASRMEL